MQKASAMADRFGISVYITIEGVFILVIYFTCIIEEKWKLGIVLMV